MPTCLLTESTFWCIIGTVFVFGSCSAPDAALGRSRCGICAPSDAAVQSPGRQGLCRLRGESPHLSTRGTTTAVHDESTGIRLSLREPHSINRLCSRMCRGAESCFPCALSTGSWQLSAVYCKLSTVNCHRCRASDQHIPSAAVRSHTRRCIHGAPVHGERREKGYSEINHL